MPSPIASLIEHLRKTALLQDGAEVGDGELLGCFIDHHDEAALAALIQRHGSMVWGVCRRLLNHHDAEDAFQATFLVLVRKAASISPRAMVGNWLYGVAYQTALQAQRGVARRREREVQVAVIPDTELVQLDQWPDLQPLLDQELSRLPDIYRAVIVLCDLEGRTRKEVARQLGVPEGTVAGRLARARTMLAKRLTQRGVTLSGGSLAMVLAQNVMSASVPDSVVFSTINAASMLAAGKAAATGPISVKVAALTEGVMKAMLFNKLKAAAIAVVLILGFVATGATILTCRTAAGQEDKKTATEKSVEPAAKQEKEAFTAWGKEVGGLQAGLSFQLDQHRVYRHGETIKLVVRVRNVSEEIVKFWYVQPFIEHAPIVTDSDGKEVLQPIVVVPDIGEPVLEERDTKVVELAPGKEIELCELRRQIRPANESGRKEEKRPYPLYATGKVRVQYEQVLGKPEKGLQRWQVDPALSNLATGKLDLEALPEKQPLAGASIVNPPKLNTEREKDEEIVTAWGKEVDGLQLGLALVPADKIAYRPGEEIKFDVRVRNVSKAPITISYGIPESKPEITDAKGKKVVVAMPPFLAVIVVPTEKVLKPGETVTLFKREVAVEGALEGKPEPKTNVSTPTIRVGAGKYKIAFSEFVQTKLILSTGSVEVEVKDKESPEKKEGFTAWGKEVGGLQAGLCISNANDIRIGEKVQTVVKLRNVSKETINVSPWPDGASYPRIVDALGKRVRETTPPVMDLTIPTLLTLKTLKPGEEMDLGKADLFVAELDQPAKVAEGEVDSFTIHVRPGKYKVDWIGFVKESPTLATGSLEFEVKPAVEKSVEPAAKQEKVKDKEIVTAWGKEVGGLQAGIGFRPDDNRVYHYGETVTLVVRVRNVGKETVKFSYLQVGEGQIEGFPDLPQVATEPLTVTDGKGKPVPQPTLLTYPFDGEPRDVVMAPDQEIRELYRLKLTLRPEKESGKQMPLTLYGTGNITVQYQQAIPMPPTFIPKPDPVLSKLATGKLELEVKEPEQCRRRRRKFPAHGARNSVVFNLASPCCLPTRLSIAQGRKSSSRSRCVTSAKSQ